MGHHNDEPLMEEENNNSTNNTAILHSLHPSLSNSVDCPEGVLVVSGWDGRPVREDNEDVGESKFMEENKAVESANKGILPWMALVVLCMCPLGGYLAYDVPGALNISLSMSLFPLSSFSFPSSFSLFPLPSSLLPSPFSLLPPPSSLLPHIFASLYNEQEWAIWLLIHIQERTVDLLLLKLGLFIQVSLSTPPFTS